jgi:mannose-6-phosphate isomerase
VWGWEKWLVSTHPAGETPVGETLVSAGTAVPAGTALSEVIGGRYPLLIKLIRAEDRLSVQVHPGDDYAREHEGDSGKTEFWYIVDADPGATLICGLNPHNGESPSRDGHPSRDALQKAIDEGTLEDWLHVADVKPGDAFFIPAGTVHAICGGITLLEVQQSSDVTYRLYDWGRDREIHVQKSLDVINYDQQNDELHIRNFTGITNPYFTAEKVLLNGVITEKAEADTSYVLISGSAEISGSGLNEAFIVSEGEAFLVMNGSTVTIKGSAEFMRAKA